MSLPRAIRVYVVLLLAVLTTHCGKRDSVVAPTIAALEGTWRLIEPDSTYRVTLQFAYDTRNPPQDITPFTASGKAAINDYNLRLFATVDGTLSAENLGSTKVGGSAQAMQFEQLYFDNLTTAARYELPTQTRLRLYHGGKQPGVLVYEKIK